MPSVLCEVNWEGARRYVVTIHGQHAYLAPGDWVITEPDGVHHYPCKPDVFEANYEPAGDTTFSDPPAE